MIQNTLANLAMQGFQQRNQDQQQSIQQRNQDQIFARQTANNDYGLDQQGHGVNRQQRQDWNTKLTDFRQENGAGATSQNLFDSLKGNDYTVQAFAPNGSFGRQGTFGDGGMMGAYNSRNLSDRGEYFDPNQPGIPGQVGKGLAKAGYAMNGYGNSFANKVGSFGDRLGNAYKGLMGDGGGDGGAGEYGGDGTEGDDDGGQNW